MSVISDDERIRRIQAILNYQFSDPTLAQLALTHRSVSAANNERLEFLGDAVLDTVISARLLTLRPEATEGELSRQRAALVRDQSLAVIAADADIGPLIELGEGERKSGGRRRQSILADAIEALLGAAFTDGGYAAATAVVDHLFAARLANLPDDDVLKDPKTRLQEWLQERALPLPLYEVLETYGKPHQQVFKVACSIDDPAHRAEASGSSRRKAEQSAAQGVLGQLAAGTGSKSL